MALLLVSCAEPPERLSPPVVATSAALTTSATVQTIGDTYLKSANANSNQGGETVLRLQSSGKNRSLVFFDKTAIQQAVGTGTLQSASLELTIDNADNGWGTTGRPITAHRLKQASAEFSATWACAIDTSVNNSTADCSGATAWNMSSTDPNVQPWLSPASDTATIVNNQTGTVSFSVTADVAAILTGTWLGHGWLLKKVDETANGAVAFVSREHGPGARLVLQVQSAGGGAGSGGGAMDAGVQSAALLTNADDYIRKGDPNQNFGSNTILRIEASGRNRAILNFDPNAIHAALGANGLRRAQLQMTINHTYPNWGPDRLLSAHRMQHDWTEPGATWNCSVDSNTTNPVADCSGATAWSMWAPDLPGQQVAFNEVPTSTAVISSNQTGVVSFDVTRDVACYLAGFVPFNGFLVKKGAEQQSGRIEFNSRETATAPMLVLDHAAGTGFTVTAAQCGGGALPDGGVPDAGAGCTPTASSDVTCNGVDDDCDGTKDEDFEITVSNCGAGACAATGERSCVNGTVQDSCVAGTPAASDANCDGIDNNCNGQVDEAYTPVATSCGVGACTRAGTSSCVSGAVQSNCTPGAPAASDASCDGIDDNCNNQKDEGYVGVGTTCGVGACGRTGTSSCVNGVVQSNCTPGAPSPSDATCDGVDDNCNGQKDEGYVGVATTCGVGTCGRTGTSSCVNGVTQSNCTPGTPAASDATCDGVDDNCNGQKDEGYIPVATSCGVGACARTGTSSCVNGVAQNNCSPGAPAASDATCDGVDDNCNGQKDEGYVGAGTACGVGACARTGTSVCVNGVLQGNCTPGASAASDATCDGIDDDCDGVLDEDYRPVAAGCGVGACASVGATRCVGGTVLSSCVPLSPAASDVSCNGVDDDCNGAIDEDYVVHATTCGVGACARAGSATCVAGTIRDDCAAGTPAASDASCNGTDDDCDGRSDEQYTPTCSGTMRTFCDQGAVRVVDCNDGNVCTGQETCSGGACHAGVPLPFDDGNACTTDGCNPVTGAITHSTVPAGTSCSDGRSCNGEETCSPPCAPGALAHWPADGNGTDIVGGHTATLNNGASFVAGTYGQAFHFDGVNDYAFATVPMASRTAATLELWLQTTTTSNSSYLFSVPRASSGQNGFDINVNGGQIGACLFTATSGNCLRQTRAYSDGAWHHVVATYDGTKLTVYFDAVSLGTLAITGALQTDADQVNIGRFGTGGAYFKGNVDEPILYDRALSAAEVSAQFATHGLGCRSVCLPGVSPFKDDQCDGIDDDCDGQTDEAFQPFASTCGVGRCQAAGIWSCSNGKKIDSCVPGSPLASDDCNGLDDDCDGRTDEGFVPSLVTCGSGPCAAIVPNACISGSVVDFCFSAAARPDNDCDGLDNDCDGTVDEGFSVSCQGSVRLRCDTGVLVREDCNDANACNGTETCSGDTCVAGTPPALDDGNVCTLDSCDPVLGLNHTPAPAGTSCADADACNGAEACWVCSESANLLRDPSFETPFLGVFPQQGLMPGEWLSLRITPDTYTNDGSYGISPAFSQNFTGVTAASGIAWVAAWSNGPQPEIFAQELNEPLQPGQPYRFAGKLHQALRSDINHPGSYELVLTAEYAPSNFPFPYVSLGVLAPTVSPSDGWVQRSLEFVAPQGAESLPLLAFIPRRAGPLETYPGLDDSSLVRTCAGEDTAPHCRAADVPRVDDANPCTADGCAPASGPTHTPVAQGTACNGTGTCNAAGACSNHLPQIISQALRWHWVRSDISTTYNYTLTATDPDAGQTLTFSLTGGPPGMQVNPSSGLVTWTASVSNAGAWPVRLRVTDNLGGFTEQRYVLQAELQHDVIPLLPPLITSQPVQVAHEGVLYTYRVTAVDDAPSGLRFSLQGSPPLGMSIDATSGVITWTPSANQLGTQLITLTVTDVTGLTDTQVFSISVANTDNPPQFLSTPRTFAVVGQSYSYAPLVRDPDGDVLSFSLGAPLSGMSIDPATGVLSFVPDQSQLGPHSVSIVVAAGAAQVTQNFTLTVGTAAERHPPNIVSVPLTSAVEGVVYGYVIEANDSDPGDVLSYAAVTLPQGATFDAASRELRWVPLQNQLGTHEFELKVNDGVYSTHQHWTVNVTAHNQSPVLVSTPALSAQIGQPYEYRCLAVDPDGDALSYELLTAPGGMTLNATSGVLDWTPSAAQQGSFAVVIRVTDTQGAYAVQSFSLGVGAALPANLAPVFVSFPVATAVSGATYSYDADAVDPDLSGPVSYALVTAPPGMTIGTQSGVVQWLADAPGSYQVVLSANDGHGGDSQQAFGITVDPDRHAPSVQLQASATRFAPGGLTTLSVTAVDEVAIVSVELSVDGAPWPLDANNRAVYQSQQPGGHRVVATAKDAAGNVGSAELLLAVTEPGDTVAPSVSFAPNVDSSVITERQTIIGTVQDDHLLRYTLSIQREGTTSWTQLNEGTQNVSNAALGVVDATRLENGIYQLRLYAEDVNGSSSEEIRPVRVDGAAKVGLVQLQLIDMVVPMAGMPVTVVRSYDSRRAAERGDFGQGWSLEVRHGSVQHNRPVGSYFALYSGDTGGIGFEFPCQRMNEQRPHFTEVRLSEREWYVFRPVLANTEAVSGGCTAEVFYEQVDGSTAGAELEILGSTVVRADHSVRLADPTLPDTFPMNLLDAYTEEPWNPDSFQLALADGRLYDLTLNDGIVRMADSNDNWLFVEHGRIAHSDGKQIDIERDTQGRVTRVRDPNGQAVSYGYDAQGDLVAVTDQAERQTRYVYYNDPAHYLRSVVRPDGVEVAAFGYTQDGRMSEACDAERHCSEVSYDLDQRVQVNTGADGRAMSYAYDARGNVTRQTDALGNAVSFAYDAHDNLTRAEGPDGSVATYTYDDSKNLTQRVLPHEVNEPAADFTYGYTYNARNQRETVTLPTGAVIRYEYDPNGNPTAVRDGSGTAIEQRSYNADGTLASHTDRFGATHYSSYDASGQARVITEPFNATIALTYDGLGRLTSRTERGVTMSMQYDGLSRPTLTDYGNGATVQYEYADAGDTRWTAIEGPTFGKVTRHFTAAGRLGDWTEPTGDQHTRLYDLAGRVREEVDPLGNSTRYAYDPAGRLQAITDVALSATTTFERDSAGRVTKMTDALGHQTRTSYKVGGRLQSTTNARGKTTSFDRTPTTASITDALNRTTVTSLSTYGLPGSTTYPGGADTSSSYLGTTRLDGSQQLPSSFQDELERTRNYGYDTKSGLTSATDLAGQSWQYQYTPSAGSAVSYDVFSGSVSTANHDGGASAYQSSGGGTEYRDVSTVGGGSGGTFTHLLSHVTSPKGEVTKFERGSNGRISKVTYPDNGTRTIAYDASNRPQTITLPQGTVVTLQHDISGRETHRETDTGEFRDLTYGPGDRIETMTDNTGTTTYHYDTAGRFVGMTYPSGGSVMYDRDVLDRTTNVRIKTTATASEIITHYDYDANGNLGQIVDLRSGVTGYSYDDADRLQQRVLPNGVVTSYGYDNRDRVLSVVHRNAGSVVLASVVYERSASGEPNKITREDGTYTRIEYDSALRVKKESEFDATDVLVAETSYGYDADGNRTSKTTLTGNETYSYAAGFKLTGITSTAGNETYGHDAGGRLTSVTRGGVARTIEYDSMDHITRVVDGGIEVERYTFDGMGRRVGVNNGASVKKFLIAPNLGDGYESPQAVVDGSGNLIASYVYAGEHPIMKITPSGVEYLLADPMGSVIGKANSTGVSTASIHYDGFGNVTGGVNTGIDPGVGFEPRMHGMAMDSSTGLYFVRARSYDSRTGRFTGRDPVLGIRYRPERYNPYVMARNNLLLLRDPSGQFDLIEISVSVGIVGILATTAMPSLSSYLQRARAARDASFVARGGPMAAGALESILKDLGTFGVLRDQNAQVPSYYLDALTSGWASASNMRNFLAEGNLSAGVDVHGSLVVPIPPGGAIGGLNRQWFYDDMSAHTYCYSDNGYEQYGYDVGVSAQSVWAWGSGPWTGDFKSTVLNVGIFSGSIFWSPGEGGWVGMTFGFNFPPGVGAGEEHTLYRTCD